MWRRCPTSLTKQTIPMTGTRRSPIGTAGSHHADETSPAPSPPGRSDPAGRSWRRCRLEPGLGRSTPGCVSPKRGQLDGLLHDRGRQPLDLGGEPGDLGRLGPALLRAARPRRCNAAMAPSRAALRNVITVERSTPWTVVICPVSIRCHRWYFCSAVRNRFARRGDDMIAGPSCRPGRPSHLWSESQRILSREVTATQ